MRMQEVLTIGIKAQAYADEVRPSSEPEALQGVCSNVVAKSMCDLKQHTHSGAVSYSFAPLRAGSNPKDCGSHSCCSACHWQPAIGQTCTFKPGSYSCVMGKELWACAMKSPQVRAY